ncbi:hypothetical protein CLV98_10714 [Dyadobacter jejuensis]|uniref:Uncharacterized protein n=1 Tax=Dyadobacter jejuensis TaxID=1082580 RepID=A0A316AJ36_9BACT|nr:hypothetical protein [Dyadobacter jejuensis]PWJ57308.1 hypothetical protein CLV98_10714 [Dyadobacter jejuensis]
MSKLLSKFFGKSKSKAKLLGEELMADPIIGRALVDISLRHGQGVEPVRVRIKDKVYLMKKLG